jgi:two-component system sensor histidine kinase PhoQ
LGRGVGQFQRETTLSGNDLYTYSFGLAWEMKSGVSAFTYSVAESLESYKEQVRRFRRSLGGWLAGLALVLLAVQAMILRWGLNPLRRVADDLTAIENGKATHLDGVYPKELQGLTNNLNALIRSEREHLDRYRHSLSDLAHSLKTPLAVVRAETEKAVIPDGPRQLLSEQVERMRQIVDYQLQRASTSGRLTLTTPVPVAESVQRVINTVVKVYAG